jgi:hypothetical protein
MRGGKTGGPGGFGTYRGCIFTPVGAKDTRVLNPRLAFRVCRLAFLDTFLDAFRAIL